MPPTLLLYHAFPIDTLEVKKVVADPKQKSVGPFVVTVGIGGAISVLIVKSAPLFEPIMASSELTTLILYPEKKGVPPGISEKIEAELTIPAWLSVPIVTGAAKLPFPSDNCAVKTLPGENTAPDVVKFTTMVEFAQNKPEIGSVTIVPL